MDASLIFPGRPAVSVDRRHAATAAAWAMVLAVSYALYTRELALEHFLWHLVYGGAVGLVVGAAWAGLRGRRPVRPAAWALAGYAYMVVPDLIWVAPTLWGAPAHPHQAWMNVFLGHVFLDRWTLTSSFLVPAAVVATVVWWAARLRALDRVTDASREH